MPPLSACEMGVCSGGGEEGGEGGGGGRGQAADCTYHRSSKALSISCWRGAESVSHTMASASLCRSLT